MVDAHNGWLYVSGNNWTMPIYKSMDEFHKHDVEPKKPDTKECILQDSIYIMF